MSAFALQYARALADVVISKKLDTAEVERQLQDFAATFAGSRELREVFDNPSIKLESKLKVLDALVPRIGLLPQVRNFFAVLLQNDRMHAVAEILSEYRGQMNLRMNIREAQVTSVRELSDQEKSAIVEKASSLTGMKVHAVYRQDASLLGGIVLRIGDMVYDGSVRGRLEELREKMLANQ